MPDERAEAAMLRKRPMQQRSAARVERMLDTAAELIAEHGYDALTTTAIAKRAGVAVGSLYQFFPDKRAIVRALTQRNLDRFLADVARYLGSSRREHWWETVEELLDIYLRMHREVPGFAVLHFGDIIDRRLLDDRRDSNQVVADALIGLFAEETGLPPSQIALPIAIAVETADALLNLAFAQAPDGDPAIVTETKCLLRNYLASRFGP